MKRIFSLFLSLMMIFSLVACGNKDSESILTNSDINKDFAKNAEVVAKELYEMRDETGYSLAGSEVDLRRAEYIKDKYEKIGLKNIAEVPIMINKWNYSGVKITFNCHCEVKSDITLYNVAAYPFDFSYDNEKVPYIFIRNSDKLDANISNKAVLVERMENLEDLENRVYEIMQYNPKLVLLNLNKDGYYINNMFSEATCPIFSLDFNGYDAMVKFKRQYEGEIELTITGSSKIGEPMSVPIVVGEIPGRSSKSVYVLVNRDTINGYIGTNMNISKMLSIAEKLKSDKIRPKYNIKFVSSTGYNYYTDKTGIESYIDTLDKDKIEAFVVLEGGYPLDTIVYTETKVSDGLKEQIEKFNTDYFAKNSDVPYINSIVGFEKATNTEADILHKSEINTIFSSDYKLSEYKSANTSKDTTNISFNQKLFNFYINYYAGLIKEIAK